MKRYLTILFDLDGTLSDPTDEILSASQYALRQFDIADISPARLQLFLTQPLLSCFEQEFALTRAQADRAFEYYWYYHITFGPQKNKLYEGIRPLLDRLRDDGRRLCVATARQTKNAQDVLRTTRIDGYFAHVVGTSEDETRRTKKMVIFDLLSDLPEHDSRDVVMVGDRVSDVTGALDNGIDVIAVTYGQEPEADLRRAGPTYVVTSVAELGRLLLAE